MYKHWSYNPTRKVYTGSYETADHLPSGLYTINCNAFGDPEAKRLELRKDSMLSFAYGPLNTVMGEINQFWDSAPHYKKLGVAHKRGILLYGPPGCGKTGIISVLIENTIERGGLVFQVDNIHYFKSAIPLTRQIENGRPIVAIMEDIESILTYEEEAVLEVMDGASSLGDGMLFLATTNYLKKIPARVRCRPSRIDTVMEIGLPDVKQREEYLNFLLVKEDKVTEKLASTWANQTEGFSLAMLKELVLAVQVYKKPLKQAIATQKQLAVEIAKEEQN